MAFPTDHSMSFDSTIISDTDIEQLTLTLWTFQNQIRGHLKSLVELHDECSTQAFITRVKTSKAVDDLHHVLSYRFRDFIHLTCNVYPDVREAFSSTFTHRCSNFVTSDLTPLPSNIIDGLNHILWDLQIKIRNLFSSIDIRQLDSVKEILIKTKSSQAAQDLRHILKYRFANFVRFAAAINSDVAQAINIPPAEGNCSLEGKYRSCLEIVTNIAQTNIIPVSTNPRGNDTVESCTQKNQPISNANVSFDRSTDSIDRGRLSYTAHDNRDIQQEVCNGLHTISRTSDQFVDSVKNKNAESNNKGVLHDLQINSTSILPRIGCSNCETLVSTEKQQLEEETSQLMSRLGNCKGMLNKNLLRECQAIKSGDNDTDSNPKAHTQRISQETSDADTAFQEAKVVASDPDDTSFINRTRSLSPTTTDFREDSARNESSDSVHQDGTRMTKEHEGNFEFEEQTGNASQPGASCTPRLCGSIEKGEIAVDSIHRSPRNCNLNSTENMHEQPSRQKTLSRSTKPYRHQKGYGEEEKEIQDDKKPVTTLGGNRYAPVESVNERLLSSRQNNNQSFEETADKLSDDKQVESIPLPQQNVSVNRNTGGQQLQLHKRTEESCEQDSKHFRLHDEPHDLTKSEEMSHKSESSSTFEHSSRSHIIQGHNDLISENDEQYGETLSRPSYKSSPASPRSNEFGNSRNPMIKSHSDLISENDEQYGETLSRPSYKSNPASPRSNEFGNSRNPSQSCSDRSGDYPTRDNEISHSKIEYLNVDKKQKIARQESKSGAIVQVARTSGFEHNEYNCTSAVLSNECTGFPIQIEHDIAAGLPSHKVMNLPERISEAANMNSQAMQDNHISTVWNGNLKKQQIREYETLPLLPPTLYAGASAATGTSVLESVNQKNNHLEVQTCFNNNNAVSSPSEESNPIETHSKGHGAQILDTSQREKTNVPFLTKSITNIERCYYSPNRTISNHHQPLLNDSRSANQLKKIFHNRVIDNASSQEEENNALIETNNSSKHTPQQYGNAINGKFTEHGDRFPLTHFSTKSFTPHVDESETMITTPESFHFNVEGSSMRISESDSLSKTQEDLPVICFESDYYDSIITYATIQLPNKCVHVDSGRELRLRLEANGVPGYMAVMGVDKNYFLMLASEGTLRYISSDYDYTCETCENTEKARRNKYGIHRLRLRIKIVSNPADLINHHNQLNDMNKELASEWMRAQNALQYRMGRIYTKMLRDLRREILEKMDNLRRKYPRDDYRRMEDMVMVLPFHMDSDDDSTSTSTSSSDTSVASDDLYDEERGTILFRDRYSEYIDATNSQIRHQRDRYNYYRNYR